MQKIFYNAQFLTMNDNKEVAESVLVNDDTIVFVGGHDEVLSMKTKETKLIDLKNQFVIPTFYDLNICLYFLIEERLKNANKVKMIEKMHENDENYENFSNFDVYLKEFKLLQSKILEKGITTIHEKISSIEEFVFWKKLAEMDVLKLDVIGYVNLFKHKQIMDDNCRSFRKYKNGFRLGGYFIELDGNILDKKAWLNKPYPHEGKYNGYAEFTDEQVEYFIKTALEEKKQLIVFADGNQAVNQFIECYEKQTKNNKNEDNFRPAIIGCNFVSKKILKKMKNLKIMPNFQIDNLIKFSKKLRGIFGLLKYKKIIPFKSLKQENFKFLINYNSFEIIDNIEIIKYFNDKNVGKKNSTNTDVLNSLICEASFNSFDLEQKGSIESGKKADFIVFDKNIFNIENGDANMMLVFKNGEEIYRKK